MRVVVKLIVFCVTGIVALSLPVRADERLHEADRAFNVGNFDRAFELYAKVRNRAKATRHQLLAAEALNSMAATELMRGRPARLDQLRRASILEKRQASGRPAKPRAAFLGRGRNLLVNGGFEAGFVLPWGSGHYERRQGRSNFGIWWNSGRARAFMKIDSDVRYAGNNALRMSNFSPSKAHVFATTAQRISGLKPNSIYRITMRIKAEQLAKSALSISVDAGWEKRLPAVPGGTYDWQLYSASINIGHNNYIDLRFIHQNVGTIWIDDISITPESEYQASPGVLAEALENRAEYQQALEVYAQIEQRAGKPSTRLRVARARILTVLGRYDEALELLLPLAQPQAGPWVREALGDLYSVLGQHTLALDHYRAAATAIAGNQAGLARVRQRMGEAYLTRVAGAATAGERVRLRQNASRELSRALRIMQHIGERHGEARTLRSIAQLQHQSSAFDKARSIQQTARKMAVSVGDEVLVTDITLDLAEGALASGTRLPSVAVLRDVLAVKRRIGDQIGIIRALELLARAHKGKGEIEQAFDRFQAAAQMLGTIFLEVANKDSDARRSLVDQFRRVLRGHIDAGFALHSMRQRVSDGIVNATFQMAQWAQFNAATAAISRMAARASAVTGDLADLARRRQDIESRLSALRRTFRTRLSQAADKRDLDEEQNLSKKISATLAELRKVDAELLERFPEYADLANPKPVSIVNIRQYLDADETLLFLLEVEDEAFAWLVTKDATEWFKLPMSPNDVKNRVLALRCGLDRSAWYDTGSLDCAQALGIDLDRVPQKYDPLPFDAGRAYTLYEALLGPAKRLIEGKHVFVVPSGALAALPFQVLVTSRPDNAQPKREADYAALAWLGKTNSLSVLPSAGSLVMLRAHAKASRAGRPFIGFGNPLLIGQDGRDLSAWSRTTCALAQRLRSATPADRGAVRSLGPMSDSGLANVEKVRRQPPLPETADELCAVARASGSVEPDRSVWLGARATERAVRKLSSSGELAGARIVHFATHGLLAGETATLARERAEPALMLTPPDRARVEDDGLLTASEVTTLKLDADWVILSACNTAAGDTIGGDSFSGLTRAFFYAGARALLVSHWYVNSQATVELVTHAFAALNQKPGLGRAEAMRRAIAHLVRPGSEYTHPEYWAPFVVVGEGGRGR